MRNFTTIKYIVRTMIVLMCAMWMTNEAKATHAMGADLTYECVGPNQYRVQLQFFRDCNGIVPELNYIVRATSASCNSEVDIWVNQQGAPEVITPLCPGEDDVCLSPAGIYGVEQYTYTGLVTLPECLPGGNDWELSWELCCRNVAITTLIIADTQEFYVTANLDNTVADCNNSPTFLNFPTPFTCVGQEVFYNHGAVDVEGDSLVFSLVDCQRVDGLPVMYEMGFSGTTPLATVGGVNIDPNTGALSFVPSAIQVGVLCVRVEEYRNDVLIGSVVRDIQFTVINCDNTLPAATDIDGVCNDGGATFEISACANANQEFCFDIQACDDDDTDIVTMDWNEAIPNATFTVMGSPEPIGTFCWTPTIDDIGTHSFTVRVEDDACPLLGTNTYTYTIEIVNNPNDPVEAGPDAQICLGETTPLTATSTASNITSYSWSPTIGLSNPNSATTDATPPSTMIYTVTALYDDGCEGTDEVTVTVADAPNILIFPTETTICPGANAVFFAGIAADAEVEWFDENGMSVGNGTPFTPAPDESTVYTAVVTDANGCTNTATSSVNIGSIQTAVCTNIYVTEDAMDGQGNGSQDNPASIGDAMDMAMCNSTVIKMAAGTYNIDSPLQLSSYLTLEGGFDPNTWIKSSQAGLTTINRTNINPEGPVEAQRLVAVQANGAVGFRLQDLTITTADALISNQEGVSTYGIHLLGCSDYDIVRCQVLPGNASDGANGLVGVDGMNGGDGEDATGQDGAAGGATNGGNGGDGGQNDFFDGLDGSLGGGTNGGIGGIGGTTTAIGFCRCAVLIGTDCGDPGQDGGNGMQGTNGVTGLPPSIVGGFYVPGVAGGNGDDGEIGSGGGGGGGVGGSLVGAGGGGGGGGGGGQGGTGGQGGHGGGNSVGIFITANGANGNIDATFVQAGNIGQGGSGGQGGTGGQGGQGGMGVDGVPGICRSDESIGGNGGQGGQGGNGGNGTDGISHTIYVDSGTPPVNQDDNTNLAAQPVITASNVNCTNLDVGFTGNTGAWSFAPNTLASGPAPPSGANTTAAFSNLGRYDVIQGGVNYAGFHNVALDGQSDPDILTDAPMIEPDVFQLCVGDAASFSTDILADEYHWDFDGAIANPSLTTQNITLETFNTPSGNMPFEITLFVTTDCCGDSPVRTILLWVDDTSGGAIPAVAAICEGERTTLNLTGVDPNSIVTWTPTASINQISQTQVEVFPTTTTTYIATVTSERNTCPTTVEREVTVNENPDIMITSTDAICGGDGTASISVSNGSGNFAYAWSHNNGLNSATANNLDFGTYTVTVTDQTTGCMDTEEVTVDPGNAPVIVVQNSSAITCTGAGDGMVQLGVNGGTQPFNFVWDNGLPPGNTQTGLTSGIMYCVTMTDANSCVANFCYETFEPPLVDIQIQDFAVPDCPNDPTGFIDANTSGGTGALTYEWSTGEDTDIITNLTSGIYTVTVTDENGCTGTESIDLTTANLLIITLDSIDVDCAGEATGAITLTLSGGTDPFTFDWDNDGIGDNDDTQNLSGLMAGTYAVTVTDADGCTATASTQINEPTDPLVLSTTEMFPLCATSNEGSIDLTVSGGTGTYAFAWVNDATGDIYDTEDLSNLVAGTYDVTVVDENFCTATTSVVLTAPDAIIASATDDALNCFGDTNGSIDLTVSGGTGAYTFDWDNDGTGDNDDTEDLTDLPEGTYFVTITDANGCTEISSATVTAPATEITATNVPMNVSCFEGNDGQIDLTVTNGAEPYTFDWDNDGTGDDDDTEDLTDLPAGDYNVTITDANGCTQTSSATITAPTEGITATNTTTNVTCFEVNDGQIDLTVTNGAEPYTFDWDNDGTGDDDDTEDLTDLPAGDYNVTITDANGCTQTSSATITAPTEGITATAIPTNILCFGIENGQIDLTVENGAEPYKYDWDNDGIGDDDDTEDLSGLAAGTYNVTITDDNGCTQTASATITAPTENITVTPQLTSITCFGGMNGEIDLTIENGTEPYTFDWDNDGTGDNDDTEDLTGLAEGTYNVTITDANGCTLVSSADIIAPTEDIIVDSTPTDITCPGETNGTIDLTITNGTAPYTFDWDNDGTGDSDDTEDLSDLAEGTYNVTITDANGCTQTASAVINTPTEGITATNTTTNVSCFEGNDGQIDLTVENGTEPYTFDWDNDGTGDNDDTEDLTDLAEGTYSVTITDANGCTQTSSATITAPTEGITILSSNTTDATCFGSDDGTISITPTGGAEPYTYMWDNGNMTDNPTMLSAGDYLVTVTDANGCTAESLFSVGHPSQVELTIAQALDPTCEGNGENGTITVSTTGGTADYTYAWSHDPALTDDTANDLSGGTYDITVTDANGCEATNTATLQSMNPPSVTATATDASCAGADGTATAEVTDGTMPYTYLWNDANAQATATAIDLDAGDYIVTVTDANDCTSTATVTVNGVTNTLIVTNTVTNITCFEANDGQIDLTVENGTEPYTFDWDNDGTGDNDDTEDLSDLAEGTYTVTVTDANGCIQTSTATITAPTEGITATNVPMNVTCFEANDGQIDLTITNGAEPYTFDWDNDGTGDNDDTEDLTDLAGGTYSVIITDANGCTQTSSATITAPTEGIIATNVPMNVTCFEANDGQIDLTITNGAEPYTFDWDNDGTGDNDDTEDLTDLAAGAYSVTITDANGCIQTSTTFITAPVEGITATNTTIDVTCFEVNDGQIDLTVTNGAEPYTFDWDNDGTGDNDDTEDLADLAGGTYSVIITDANGCTQTSSATITAPTEGINALIFPNDITCFGVNDGEIDLVVENGAEPYTFDWDNDGTGDNDDTQNLTDLPAGDYNVTITDANGCTQTASASITAPTEGITASTTSTNMTCFDDANGTIDLNVSNGTAPYTFEWDYDGTGDNDDPEDLTDLTAGNYNVTITDASGCTQTASASVVQPEEVVLTTNQTDPTCGGNGQDGTITVSTTGGTADYTYNWSHDITLQQATATDLPGGTYTITTTDANGCTATAEATLIEVEVPTLTVSAIDASCGNADGSAIASPTGGAMPYTYLWDDPNSQMTDVAAGLSAGSYTVTVTDASGCTVTATASVSDSDAPTATATSTNASCGESNGTATVEATGGTPPYFYQWDDANMQMTQTAIDLPAGIYNVTVSDGNGCVAVANTEVIDEGAPTAVATATDASCMGADGTTSVTVMGGTMPYTFLWNDPNGQMTDTATGLDAGDYTVTVTDANNCTATATATVGGAVNSLTATTTSTSVSCFGGDDGQINLTVENGAIPYTFDWDNDGTGDNDDTEDLTGLSAGVYIVTITDANGCTQTASRQVTEPTELILNIDQEMSPTCAGNGENGTISLFSVGGTPGYTYQWSHDAMLTQATANNLSGGIYTFTVTDANGCAVNSTATLQAVSLPNVTATGIDASCGAADGSAIATASDGVEPYTYQWDDPAMQITETATGLSAGSYTVTVTDADGCAATATASVSDSGAPTATTTSTDASCGESNGIATVEATGGTTPYGYQWDDAAMQITPTATNLPAGDYNVTVTDAVGCIAVASVTVGGTDAPTVAITGTDTSCGESNGSATVSVTGGMMPYTYQWDDPNMQITPTASDLPAGNYSVTITDANNCIVIENITIADSDAPTATATSTDASAGGSDGTATVTASGGTMPYTYQWDDAAMQMTETATGLSGGMYNVTVTDANGCTTTASVVVNEAGAALSATTSAQDASCDEANGTATVTAIGGMMPYTYQWDDPAMQMTETATGLPAGTYNVTVTDANGDMVTADATINDAGVPTATATSTDASSGGSDGTATATASGGTPPYTYQWDDAAMQMTETATDLPAGTYNVTVTDANGCTATANVAVNESGSPLSATTVAEDASCGESNGTATVAVTGGAMPYTYQWNDAAMQMTETATGLPAGTYTVTVTDANGDTVTADATINDSGGPTAMTTSIDATCGASDGSAMVIAAGGTMPYTYQWDDTNMQITQTASDLPAGNYSVTVSDANNCIVIENITINDAGAPSVVVTGTPSTCGANDGTGSATASGGIPPYTYLWDNGDMTADVTGLSPGIQGVTVTDANNCMATGSVNIEDEGAPMSTVSSSPTDCGGSDGMATVTSTGGTPPYTYLWSDGQMTATAIDLSAGNYTVTITDANNCADVIDVIVGNLDGPIATATATPASCGDSDGTATVTATGGALPYSYQWDDANMQTTQTASNLPTGNYNVTVTDASDCVAVVSVLVDELSSGITFVDSLTIVIDASCEAIPNGEISVTATGGTVANIHDYVWNTNPPTNNPVVQNLAPGTYTVTATDDLGCSATMEVEIGTIIGIMTNETINPISCFGSEDGWINILLTGGSAPYTAEWSNGFVGTDNQDLGAGDYTVTITDYAGCMIIETFTIDAPPPTIISNVEQIIGSNCALADGSIEVSATGGTTPYIYNWSHDVTIDTPLADNLPAGSYTVTIIDSEGCEAIQDAEVPSIGDVDVSATQVSGVLCPGDSNGVATANGTGGTAPYTFTWENSNSTDVIADDLPAGTIGVTITDAAGCTNFTTVEIDTPPLLEVAASGVATDCNSGGTVTATATGGTAPFTYTWSGGIGTGETVTDVDFGTYDVTVTDANDCTATISTILAPPTSVDLTVAGIPTSCFNTNDGQATATVTSGAPPYDFVWDNGEITNPATALGGGIHTLTVTDVNGCESTAEFEIDSPLPIVPQSAGTTPVSCIGGNDGSATIVASGGTGNYTYEWSNGMNGETITDLTAGVYTVSITDGIGCTSPPINVTVVEPLDGVDIEMEFLEPSCGGGGDGAVTAVPEGGVPSYSYLWSTGDTGQTAFGLSADTYTVTVTDANGCTATQSVDMTEPTSIAFTYDTQDVICFGDETGTIEISSTGGGSDPYVYALGGGPFVVTPIFGGLGAGSYELNVQDANGCIISETVVIDSEFELQADLGADVMLNLGDSTELFVQTNSTDSLTYTWIPADGLSCNDCPNPTVQTFQATTYQVQVTNQEGCTATDNITVGVDLTRNLFIPNVFSPNDDGANDRFMIFGGQGVVGVNTFKVYDRWGEMVWDANNFRTDDPEQGWDGTFRGQRMNPAVFVYYAEVEFIDGVTVVYQGDVTLVR